MCGYICWFIRLFVLECACKVVGVYASMFDLRVFDRPAGQIIWLTDHFDSPSDCCTGLSLLMKLSLFMEENQQQVIINSFIFLMLDDNEQNICLQYSTVLCCLSIHLLKHMSWSVIPSKSFLSRLSCKWLTVYCTKFVCMLIITGSQY